MANWGFLTNHARVLLCIAHDPGARLRDIAVSQGITERSAHAIVADLAQAGYVVKRKDGRRNRYQIEAHLPLAEPGTREPAVGEVLDLLLGHHGSDEESQASPARASSRPARAVQMASPPGSTARAWTAENVSAESPNTIFPVGSTRLAPLA
jgi:MarR family